MITSVFKHLAWTLLLLLVQALVLDRVHPWGLGAPLLFPLAVITLPLGTSRTSALLWGFGTGFVADVFAGTSGIGSAAMTLVALVQPPLLEIMSPRDSEEQLRPSFLAMGRWNYVRFLSMLLFLHHVVYFSLEGFSYFHLADVAASMGVSFVFSLLLALVVEQVRNPRK